LGLDWGRVSDQTIAMVGNNQNDALDWFAYPKDHPLAATFEEQTIKLDREYKGDGEFLSVHHPDEPGGWDDYFITYGRAVRRSWSKPIQFR
jgi:hypothetical protein